MEDNFKVFVKFFNKEEDAILEVIPQTDSWELLLDGISLGTLANDGNDRWYWLEGNLTTEDAELIGHTLEAHYK